MFEYKKFLEYPIKIKNPNPRLANVVITQYGGPNGKGLSIGIVRTEKSVLKRAEVFVITK